MRKHSRFLFLLFILMPSLLIAQQKDSLIKKLDSLGNKVDRVGAKQKNVIAPEAYNETTKITSVEMICPGDIKANIPSSKS